MKGKSTRRFAFFGSVVLGLLVVFALIQLQSVQAQIPGLPKLPGGVKIPGVPSGKSAFLGVDALSAAKELYGDKGVYPTPNIAVSGSNVVIAWPNGVVTIESIGDDGTIRRTVLGPPSEKNIF